MSKRGKQGGKSTTTEASAETKLTHKEFVEKAIRNLRTGDYLGIHVVYSGFNNAFREYFGADPRPILDGLKAEGFITSSLCKGGAKIALKADIDAANAAKAAERAKEPSPTLAKILG